MDELEDAIKTLQKPVMVDPLARHDFDSFIVESYKRQRHVVQHKKNQVSSKSLFAQEASETPQLGPAKFIDQSKSGGQERSRGPRLAQKADVEMTETDQEKTQSPVKAPKKGGRERKKDSALLPHVSQKKQAEKGHDDEDSDVINTSSLKPNHNKKTQDSDKPDPEAKLARRASKKSTESLQRAGEGSQVDNQPTKQTQVVEEKAAQINVDRPSSRKPEAQS